MRIILPVSKHDATQFQSLVQVMAKFGGLNRQVITIVPTPSQIELAQGMAGILQPLCDELDILTYPDEPTDDAWPQNPNAMWRFVANNMLSRPGRLPWFWMEADCLPIKAGWADKLDVAYTKAGEPFMGFVKPTPQSFPDGTLAPFVDGDTTMLGCAIYHPDTARWGDDDILIRDLMPAKIGGTPEPWDVYLRWIFKKHGVAHTPMVGDYWRTHQYRVEDGELRFNYIKNGRQDSVDPECWLVHGCKDQSLATLILNEAMNLVVEKKQGQHGAVSSADMEKFWKRMAELDERIVKLEKLRDSGGKKGPLWPLHPDWISPWEKGNELPQSITSNSGTSVITVDFAAQEVGPKGEDGPVGHVGIPGPTAKEHGIIKRLQSGEKIRVNDAAKQFGITKGQVLDFLKENGFKMGQAGWIQPAK